MTELIMHGYVVAVLPRTGRAPEIVLRAPSGGLGWMDAHQLDVLIATLERELEVMRAARGMIEASVAIGRAAERDPLLQDKQDLRID